MSKRLQAIANLITTKRVIDVGCDHGILENILSNKKIYALGIDISPNSISYASKKYISKYSKFLVNDGLENITINDTDTVAISGLGTNTILNIIGDRKIKNLIISSHNYLDTLRYKMSLLGYKILYEEVVFENNIYYVIMKFTLGNKKYTKKELVYGPYLLENPPRDYYQYLLNKNLNILKNIPKKYFLKRYSLHKEIKDIKKILNK